MPLRAVVAGFQAFRVDVNRLPAAWDKAFKIFGVWLLLANAEAKPPRTDAVRVCTIVNAVAGG